MAHYIVAGFNLFLFWRLLLTFLHTVGTAGMELTAGGRICRRRNGAFQHNPVHLRIRVRNGNRGEQCLRVGVQRVTEDICRLSVLHQIAQIHDAHRIRNMLHNA